ncbi:hypothetical protein HPB48_000782 [Haemaphysalis longicornis]|uniref:TRAF1-6 MATH domain-containing protein n=1 Tax=Haemaphysalis longicornis TaxID=44386 RepID=A0A9J6FC38_HAELO|nr:hypothetical protein HPB48_000782 [Haemaphysalis longicornis]
MPAFDRLRREEYFRKFQEETFRKENSRFVRNSTTFNLRDFRGLILLELSLWSHVVGKPTDKFGKCCQNHGRLTEVQETTPPPPLQIFCWNKGYGCKAVGHVSKILEHFSDDCGFHTVFCPECDCRIAKRNIVDHHESSCRGADDEKPYYVDVNKNISLVKQEVGKVGAKVSLLQTWLQENIGQIPSDGENSKKVSLPCVPVVGLQQCSNITLVNSVHLGLATMTEVSKAHDTLKANLEAVECSVYDAKSIADKVKESQVSIDDSCSESRCLLKEQTRQINATKNDLEDSLKSIETTMAEWLKKKPATDESVTELKTQLSSLEKTSQIIFGLILDNAENGSSFLDWTITDWSAALETASQSDKKLIQPEEPKYFYGYSILPGIEVETLSGGQWIRCVFSIHQGEYDELLSWPFRKTISFVIGHPADTRKAEFACATAWGVVIDRIKKPKDTHNEIVRIFRDFRVSDLEKDGCVQGNEVCIKVAVRA